VFSPIYFIVAAIAEIAGCFAFWYWLRLDKSALWAIPGTLCLIAFAILLTRVDSLFAGRTYASYGGIYIVASLGWLWLIEDAQPDRWDIVGGTVCLLGTAIIIWAPRTL